MKQMTDKLTTLMTGLARTRIHVGEFPLPAFQVCGYTGLAFALALGAFLVRETGLSLWNIAGLALAAMGTFLCLAMITKIVTGTEQLIYYHHEIAIVLVTGLISRLLHQPVLRYLDITILAVGTFLTFGRIGCLMVGCCHGRPSTWGICYREEHEKEGFARYLVGVRLFPIQAVEALWVFTVVAIGTKFVLGGAAPGTALAWYTIAYGSARFLFEFVRGDTDRPYTLGFSQGQWLSLWLMSALVWAELSGRIAFQRWHVMVAFALPLIMLLVALRRKSDTARTFQIVHPHHVREIAGAMQSLEASCSQQPSPAFSEIPIVSTSIGLQISAGTTRRMGKVISHITISCRGRRLTRQAAQIVADVIQQLGVSTQRELVSREEGVFHMLLPGAQNGGLHE
jgi:uncharacterized membrane protein YhdT